ncbi:HAMP domain-containing sensor histidine kinase [Ilumatobacter sp.]|uniref:HAMP domain-containing sensor histidine kinase n=1 Tax=Ilumatobacter sp. TaxID=1967498 RepID=UPI003B520958
MTVPGPFRRLADGLRPATAGLRRRILLIITLGSIALSSFLAITTFGLTRSNLVQERDEAAIATSRRNALAVESALRPTAPPDAFAASQALANTGVRDYTIWYQEAEYGGTPPYTRENIPADLFEQVVEERLSGRQISEVGDELNIVVGWAIPDIGAYFEFFPIDDVDSNLSDLRVALVLAGLITTGLGVLVGVFAARRAVRPLGTAARAASAIAGGRLDTRLESTDDPDLRVLTESFNDMAAALERRIERDARFASDVSHELRSPLMTLAASVEVMEARRDDLPDRARSALDLLSSDVVRFQGLVEDLLEISRFDAGAIRLNMDEMLAAEFVRQAVAVSSLPQTPVHVSERAESSIIRGDKRRLARVVANLIDNARAYGGGEPEVTMEIDDPPGEPVSHLTIAVEDRGMGVAPEERSLIFERFARGGGAGRRTGSEGAGLGLSLVDEHVRMHGGRVWVEDRLDGEPGARFVIELMATELDE